MPSTAAAAKQPITGLVLLAGTVVAGACVWLGLPALVALWVALLVSALTHPAPVPAIGTGVGRGASEAAVAAADPVYTKRLRAYRYWSGLRLGLFCSKGMWPSFPPKLTWVVAVCTAALVLMVPVGTEWLALVPSAREALTVLMPEGHVWLDLDPEVQDLLPWLNAAAAFAMITALSQARRENLVRGDTMRAVHFGDVAAPLTSAPHTVIAPGVSAGILALVVAAFSAPLAPAFGITVTWPLFTAFPVLATTLALMPSTSKRVTEHFLAVAASREEWEARFLAMKIDPPHRLLDFAAHGDPQQPSMLVETFLSDARTGGSAGTEKMLKNLEGSLGGGWKATVAPVDSENSAGEPIPGTVHALKFDVIRYPNGTAPDVSSWEVSDDEATAMFRYAFARFSQEVGATVRLDQSQCISATPPAAGASESGDGAPGEHKHGRLWMLTFTGMGGEMMRQSAPGSFGSTLGHLTLVDHRFCGGAGVMVLGDFDAPLAEDSPLTFEQLEQILEEDSWNAKWIELMKMGSNPPRPEFATRKVAALADGTEITSLGFVTRNGIGHEDFFKLEPKLATMLDAAPFASLAGWEMPGRPGERHPQAFALRWSTGKVPARPDDVKPVPGSDAPKWVLAHLVHSAFAASKLARPELVNARAMTAPRSRKHVWRLRLRLHGGVTLADVRRNATRIRQVWASDWLRVAEADDGCEILVGALPSRTEFSSPRAEHEVDSYDWEQVFLDSSMEGLGGKVPRLVSSSHLENNPEVKVLTFDATGTGITFDRVRGNRGKLESNSANAWVDPVPVGGNPAQFVLRTCHQDPMPRAVPHNWEKMAATSGMTFGVDLEGSPVTLDPARDPHLLFSGMSGAGKTVSLQSMVASAIMHRWDLVIIDPSKAAADFRFAVPWAAAMVPDLWEAGAAMSWVYAEVTRRKSLNAQYGKSHIKHLPEEVRPNHLVVFIDEFTSLMIPSEVPPVTGDPELDAQREQVLAANRVRAEIGNLTGRVGREARSAGVTLVLATQALKAETLSKIRGVNDLKDNLSRVLQGKASAGQLAASLKNWPDAPPLGDDVPRGRGVFETNESGFIVYQAFYHPAEQDHLTEELTRRVGLPQVSPAVDLQKYMPVMPDDTPAVVDLDHDPSAPDEVVDLGGLDLGDLDLGDLELDAVDADEAAGAEEDDVEGDRPPAEPEVEPVRDWFDRADENGPDDEEEWVEPAPAPVPSLPALPPLPDPEPVFEDQADDLQPSRLIPEPGTRDEDEVPDVEPPVEHEEPPTPARSGVDDPEPTDLFASPRRRRTAGVKF